MSKSSTTTARPIPAGGLARMRHPPTHPGEIFRYDFREAADPPISQAEAARRLRWSTVRMNQFETGKRGVTPENAVLLSLLTGTSAEFWMHLQVQHDLWHAIRKVGKQKVKAVTGARLDSERRAARRSQLL